MSIIEIIKEKFSPEFISKIATQVGESESGISKAIGILLPSVLGKISENSKNSIVIDIISETRIESLENPQMESSKSLSSDSSLQHILFGNGINEILSLTSKRSDISIDSVKSVLNIIIKSIEKTIGDYVHKNNIEHQEISNFLENQKFIVPSILPTGLSLDNIGLKDFVDCNLENNSAEINLKKETNKEQSLEIKNNSPVTTPTPPHKNEDGFWRWLLPLILLGLIAWFFWKLYEKQNIPNKIHIEQRK